MSRRSNFDIATRSFARVGASSVRLDLGKRCAARLPRAVGRLQVPQSHARVGFDAYFPRRTSCPGAEVVVPSPHWMPLPKLVGFVQGATYRSLPIYLDLLEGRLDAAGFKARLEQAIQPQTRGIYLNTPNNPTGAVLTREQLVAL